MFVDSDLCRFDMTIDCADAYEMAKFDKEKFIAIRRNGFGASDSSIVLGVNPFNTPEDLIKQKLATTITAEEIAIGEKENVRKGADLEPIILNKFEQWSSFATSKPNAMYRLTNHPQLTVNFDGIINMSNICIPVEAKYVSAYANKYWDRSKAIDAPYEGTAKLCGGAGLEEHLRLSAELYGIPVYYYTQVQQQLLSLTAPFGYLAALFDKGWELKVFKIFADEYTQKELIVASEKLWKKIEEKREA